MKAVVSSVLSHPVSGRLPLADMADPLKKDPKNGRKKVHIVGISDEVFSMAKKISKEINQVARPAEKPFTLINKLSQFQEFFNQAATKLGLKSDDITAELIAVTAYYSVPSKNVPKGSVKGLWKALQDNYFNEEIEFLGVKVSGSEIKKAQIKLLLCHLLPKPCKTAHDLECLDDLSAQMRELGILQMLPGVSPCDLVPEAFPELITSPSKTNPAVRKWKLNGVDKWTRGHPSAILVGEATAWIMMYGAKVLDPETMALDVKRFANTEWLAQFKEQGISGMFNSQHSTVADFHSAFLLAEKVLGRKIIGQAEGQIPLWDIKLMHKWQSLYDGELLIDKVARFLVFNAKKESPEMNSEDGRYGINEQAFCKYGWAVKFDKLVPCALKACKLSPVEALARVAPDIFGWEKGQILDLHMNISGKFQGEMAKPNLSMRLAHALYREGLGSVIKIKGGVRFTVASADLELWASKPELKKSGYIADLTKRHALIGPIDNVWSGNFRKALNHLFGNQSDLPEEITGGRGGTALIDALRYLINTVNQGEFSIHFSDNLHKCRPFVPEYAQLKPVYSAMFVARKSGAPAITIGELRAEVAERLETEGRPIRISPSLFEVLSQNQLDFRT